MMTARTHLFFVVTALLCLWASVEALQYTSYDVFYENNGCSSAHVSTVYVATKTCYGDGAPSLYETCNATHSSQYYCIDDQNKCSNCHVDFVAPLNQCTNITSKYTDDVSTIVQCHDAWPIQSPKTVRIYFDCEIKASQAIIEFPLGCTSIGLRGAQAKCTTNGGVIFSDCDAQCNSCEYDYYIPPGCSDFLFFEAMLTCQDSSEDSEPVPSDPHKPLPARLQKFWMEQARKFPIKSIF